jgi:hypothetical protein
MLIYIPEHIRRNIRLSLCLVRHRLLQQRPPLSFPLQWRRPRVLLPPSMRPQYLHRLRRSLGPLPRLHFRDPLPRSVLRLRPLQHLVVASPPQSPSPPQCLWGRSLTLPPPPLRYPRRGKDTTRVENGTPTMASRAVVCSSLPRPDLQSAPSTSRRLCSGI